MKILRRLNKLHSQLPVCCLKCRWPFVTTRPRNLRRIATRKPSTISRWLPWRRRRPRVPMVEKFRPGDGIWTAPRPSKLATLSGYPKGLKTARFWTPFSPQNRWKQHHGKDESAQNAKTKWCVMQSVKIRDLAVHLSRDLFTGLYNAAAYPKTACCIQGWGMEADPRSRVLRLDRNPNQLCEIQVIQIIQRTRLRDMHENH